jgi:hypothetical protein
MVLVGTTPAAAADNYYTASDFGTEGASYPAGWFLGDVAGGSGTIADQVSGLAIDATTKAVQILNSDSPGGDLTDLVDGAAMTMFSGDAVFQIPLFANPAGPSLGFTTLRPAVLGDAGLDSSGQWITSQTLGSYAAGDTATLQEFETALPAGYQILAFGAYVPVGSTAVISSITWAGNTHWFMPRPTGTVTPASVTPSEFSSTGVSATLTGFWPNEVLSCGLGAANSGGPIAGTFQADSAGSITVNYIHSGPAAELGNYVIGCSGVNGSVVGSNAVSTASFVLADALAATGADITPIALSGGILLLTGLGFAAVATRRRTLARR